MRIDWRKYIILDPEIMFGKPVFIGTRIPVELILEKMAEGENEDDLLHAYPLLNKMMIQAALSYATDAVRNDVIFSSSR